MAEVLVTCGHCNGTGTCTRHGHGLSCSSCREAAGQGGRAVTVVCDVCKGAGKVIVR